MKEFTLLIIIIIITGHPKMSIDTIYNITRKRVRKSKDREANPF